MSNYAPWYVILWRLLWFVPMHLALILFCVMVAFAYGPRLAAETFNDMRMQ